MGLNENHLICIFMNINENDENQDLQRENNYIAILKGLVWVNGCNLNPQNKCSSVPVWSEDHFNAHLCHLKSQSVQHHP